MHIADWRTVQGKLHVIRDVVCQWCSRFCDGRQCLIKQAQFVLMVTKKRNECGRCGLPIECRMKIYWHPRVTGLALHDECADKEGLASVWPNPELADPELLLAGAIC